MNVLLAVPPKDYHSSRIKAAIKYLTEHEVSFTSLGTRVSKCTILDSLKSEKYDVLILFAGMDRTNPFAKEIFDSVKEEFPKVKLAYSGQFVTDEIANNMGVKNLNTLDSMFDFIFEGGRVA